VPFIKAETAVVSGRRSNNRAAPAFSYGSKQFDVSGVGLAKAGLGHHIPLPGEDRIGQKNCRDLPETVESWMDSVAFQGNFKRANQVDADEIAEGREPLLTATK